MTHSRFTGPGILRLYLALMVVLQHFDIVGLGATAVYLFFVMSGFWITALWQQKYVRCNRPYFTFLISRYWRLFPLYFICVALMAWTWRHESPRLFQLFLDHDYSAVWLARVLLIVSSNSQPTCLIPTWSLDVEMQFYLIAPLLIGILGPLVRKGGTAPFAFALPLSVVSIALFFISPSYCPQIARFLSFFIFGSLIQYFKWRPGPRLSIVSLVCFTAITGLLLALPSTRPFLATRLHMQSTLVTTVHGLYSLLAVGCLLPAVAYCLGQRSDPLDRAMGDLAYPIYLFHLIPIELVARMPRLQALGPMPRTIITLFLIIAGSLVLYYCVDRPIDRMRQRFVKSRQRTPPAVKETLIHA